MTSSRKTSRSWSLQFATLATGILLAACAEQSRPSWLDPDGTPPPPVADDTQKIEVPPPPFSDDIFPCTDCHDPDLPVNTKRRKLKLAHQDIVLHHDEQHRWCLDCHSVSNRDKLHLANGTLVDFTESYRLCGQCHGDKYRDWRAGVHGRRSGYWNGRKTYLLCVNCHNSHSPAFKPLEPKPMPKPPEPTK